ncbi:hypothetical protein KH5_16260 [Urechidicola sp. KH5]
MPKTWQEKFDTTKPPVIKVIDKRFADIQAGQTMSIATPRIIDTYVKNIPYGSKSTDKAMRNDLSKSYKTCPVTLGIFLRIASEVAYKEFQNGKSLEQITSFWRMVEANSPLAKKLDSGVDFILEQQIKEDL